FAVTAYESRQPFTAESALGRLSPDLGPMRGWFPYWEVLTSAFHAEQKHGPELNAARETLRRFPDRIAAYITEARALAATHKATEFRAVLLLCVKCTCEHLPIGLPASHRPQVR